jgi:hypothetical protein
MFAAAMLYSTPSLELSIYSTCKRISQKLMRNVTKFVDLIYAAIPGTPPMPVIRSNMEEVVLQGPDGSQDVRIVNSYPSKVVYTIHVTRAGPPPPVFCDRKAVTFALLSETSPP